MQAATRDGVRRIIGRHVAMRGLLFKASGRGL